MMIAADHPIVRDALAQLVFSQKSDLEFKIVCRAGNAGDALAQIKTVSLDMIILEISLEGTDGIELVKQMRSLEHDVKILVL